MGPKYNNALYSYNVKMQIDRERDRYRKWEREKKREEIARQL